MNVVCTGDGSFVEVQGTAEREPFGRELLDELLDLAVAGCAELTKLQQAALGVMTSATTRRPPRLVLATANQHKLAELTRILAAGHVDVAAGQPGRVPRRAGRRRDRRDLCRERPAQGARDRGVHRAARGRRRLRLCVDALNGMPGVLSARWSGRHGDDEANLALLLAQLPTCPTSGAARSSSARPRWCCRAAASTSARAIVHGSLIREPRGQNGFGYDPIFVPASADITTAEMDSADKDAISHRGKALRALAPVIAALLG